MISTLPLLVVSRETVRKALSRIEFCQACFPYAEYEFKTILDVVKNSDNEAEYVLGELPHCPHCGAEIRETTLVQMDWT